ncbi:MAG: hypothetical protein A2020_04170 [Lentisphaerae bacterium GWF2_45_14]|nr:MAG: hypothetical protein A2020_04170 [Lentisphaerae bacterium GWF2_45_14]
MDIYSKIFGCFIGKSVGGTLGMPHEGVETFLDLDYYSPVPDRSLPNDDIDLQLVWCEAFKDKRLALTNKDLALFWEKHIDAHPDEYGIALWNIKRGIKPPLTGIHNNEAFRHGMGAAIRSEIWAALFPGKPLTAAYFAWQDASVDHDGEGIYAEVFLAAAQSHLYTSGNLRQSIDYGIGILPSDSKLKAALIDTEKSFDSGMTYLEARDRVMRLFGSVNFTDVVMNLSFILIGLLHGRGDFSDSITMAVNCGQDADCTGATTAAFMGILLGKEAIPERWVSKVGTDISVGDYIKGIKVNSSIDSLANDILSCHKWIAEEKALPSLELPFVIPKSEDFSDGNPWLVEGEKIVFDGLKLDNSKYSSHVNKEIHFKTNLSFNYSGDIQMMIASKGIFRAYWNGRYMGVKGDQMIPVPAIHRVRGGRCFNLSVNKGENCELEIVLYPTFPVPDLYVAFGDMQCRHLDVNYNI